jgi:hypothetical protein
VGTRVGLDKVEKRKIPSPSWESNPLNSDHPTHRHMYKGNGILQAINHTCSDDIAQSLTHGVET